MRTIAILNLKGGVGKTITSTNLAHILAKKFNKKVLLIDNDKQGNLSQFFKVPMDKLDGTSHLFLGDTDINDCIVHTEHKNLDIIPTSLVQMRALKELEVNPKYITKHDRMAQACGAVNVGYDFCIIDNAPDLNLAVVNALIACDDVIIPLKIDEFSFTGLELLEEQINEIRMVNKKLRLAGCLITMHQPNKLNADGIKRLKTKTPYPIFNTTIRHTVNVSRSIEKHTPLLDYIASAPVTDDYINFTKEYLKGVPNE